MRKEEFIARWKSAFACNVPEEVMRAHVESAGNMLWHVFTFGGVPCLQGDQARRAFENAEKENALVLSYWEEKAPRRCPPNATAADFEGEGETLIAGGNFRWTYVVTHEECFGPYFAVKQPARG